MGEIEMRNRTIRVIALALFVSALALPQLVAQSGVNFKSNKGKIAFVSGVDLYTVNPDGSDLKQLTNFGSSGNAQIPSWSSDGDKLLFAFTSASDGSVQIWEIDARGGNLHQVLNDPSFADTDPNFSPHGTNILFTRCTTVHCAIFRVNSDGTGLRAITHFDHNPDITDFQATYSPDGETIAFASWIRGGLLSAIYLMNADGSNIRPLTPPELLALAPEWSPDGRTIAFSAHNGVFGNSVLDEEIWSITIDGKQLTRLTDNNQNWKGYFSGLHDFFPSWSPDGDAIVFERDAPDYGSAAIYIMNSDGSRIRAVRSLQPRMASVASMHVGRAYALGKSQSFQLLENNANRPSWGPAPE